MEIDAAMPLRGRFPTAYAIACLALAIAVLVTRYMG